MSMRTLLRYSGLALLHLRAKQDVFRVVPPWPEVRIMAAPQQAPTGNGDKPGGPFTLRERRDVARVNAAGLDLR